MCAWEGTLADTEFGPPPSSATPPTVPGEAGSDFLSGVLAGPTDSAAAKQVQTEGAHLKALAEGQGFAINEEGHQAYAKACDFFLQGYTRMADDLRILASKAAMGSSTYAHSVAEFNVKVANGDPESMLPNIDLMRKGIEQAREALDIALKNYKQADDSHSISFAEMNRKIENS